MPKNVVDASLNRIFQTFIPDHKRLQRANRVDQISPLGYFPLKNGLSTIIEVDPTVPNGAMYYATDLAHARGKSGGTWHNVF